MPDTSEAPDFEEQPEEQAQGGVDNATEVAAETPAGPQTPEEEIAHLKDQLIRVIAEMENLRKRTEKEKEDAFKYANAAFAGDLINVLENLERTKDSVTDEDIQTSTFLEALMEGVNMTLTELSSVFEKHGIKRIDPKGDPYDHNLHQAVTKVPTNEFPPNTVLDVIRAGFQMKERLLRPAMVTISMAPAENEASEAPSENA